MSDESSPLRSGAMMLDGLGERHGLATWESGSRLLVAAGERSDEVPRQAEKSA